MRIALVAFDNKVVGCFADGGNRSIVLKKEWCPEKRSKMCKFSSLLMSANDKVFSLGRINRKTVRGEPCMNRFKDR